MKRPLETLNVGMIAFDLALGTVAVAAPRTGLRLFGHSRPSDDAVWLFRRSGPVWLTFAGAHLAAAARGRPEDWWALAWLRGTEIATDALWASSPGFAANRRARTALWLAGVGNAVMAAGFAKASRGAGERQRASGCHDGAPR
jgi:hypothetical protein